MKQNITVKKKGIVSLLAALCFGLAMMPLAANAQTTHQVADATDLAGVLGGSLLDDGDVIELTATFTYPDAITIDGKSITIDLKSLYTLEVNNNSASDGLRVINGGEIKLVGDVAGTAEFNVTSTGGFGVWAADSSIAGVSNATGFYAGVYANGDGTSVTVGGEATATGANSAGVYALSGATIAVTGNATGGYFGVQALSGATIAVTGHATGGYFGVQAIGDGTSVTVGGNATAADAGSYGVYAESGATVAVTGHATGGFYGVYAAADDTSVTVGGDATGTSGNGVSAIIGASVDITGHATGGNNGVSASSGATVDITGDATGGSYGVYATGTGTSVIVGGNAKATDSAIGSIGVLALNGATVDVTHDATGFSRGVDASGTGTSGTGTSVTVGGDAKATGNATTSDGVYATGGATVAVTGDATGGSYGVDASGGGTSVTVGGEATATGANSTGVFALNGASVVVTHDATGFSRGVEATGTGTSGTGTSVTVGGEAKATGNATTSDGVYATGGATVDVTGHATGNDRGVYAGNAGTSVTVGGNVAGTIRFGVLALTGAKVAVTGHATGGFRGVEADGAGASVTVGGNVASTTDNGVNASNGATIAVTGNATGGKDGVWVANAGTSVTVGGNATGGSGTNSYGVIASSGATVAVTGDATGGDSGVNALGSGTSITVGGHATGTDSYGVLAESGAKVAVTGHATGNLSGVHASDAGTSVTVGGDVAGTSVFGVYALNGASVDVTGDATGNLSGVHAANAGTSVTVGGDATGTTGYGVYAATGATVTVGGAVSGAIYISVNSVDKTSLDGVSGIRTGYWEYSEGSSFVWVRDGSPLPLVQALPIAGITKPAAGETPATAPTATAEYTGTVSWTPADNPFADATDYTARITLEAADGFTFNTGSGEYANTADIAGFTVNGAAPTAWQFRNDTKLIFEVTFPAIPTYTLTVVSGTDNTALGLYAAGETVSITADAPPAGQVFDRWTSNAGGTFANDTDATTTFTMPASAATVTATYKSATPPTPPTPPTPATPPAISGPASMTLEVGYAATSTDAYTITGTTPVAVAKTAGDSRITWNSSTRRLDIAAGLPVGVYPVTLRATNSATASFTFTFTLTVAEDVYYLDIPAAFDGGTVVASSSIANPYLAEAGSTVTLTITPDAGYALNEIVFYRLDANLNTVTSVVIPLSGTGAVRTFTMPAYNIAIVATFAKTVGVETHSNASLQAYARDGVLYVSGLTAGQTVSVYNIVGTLVYRFAETHSNTSLPLPARGVYIVTDGKNVIKVIN